MNKQTTRRQTTLKVIDLTTGKAMSVEQYKAMRQANRQHITQTTPRKEIPCDSQ